MPTYAAKDASTFCKLQNAIAPSLKGHLLRSHKTVKPSSFDTPKVGRSSARRARNGAMGVLSLRSLPLFPSTRNKDQNPMQLQSRVHSDSFVGVHQAWVADEADIYARQLSTPAGICEKTRKSRHLFAQSDPNETRSRLRRSSLHQQEGESDHIFLGRLVLGYSWKKMRQNLAQHPS